MTKANARKIFSDRLGEILQNKQCELNWQDSFIEFIDHNIDQIEKNPNLIDSKSVGKILELSEEMIGSKHSSFVTNLLEVLYTIGLLKEYTLVKHKCEKILEILPKIKDKCEVRQAFLNTL